MALLRDWELAQNFIRTTLVLPPVSELAVGFSCIWGFQNADRLTQPLHISMEIADIISLTPYPEIETTFVVGNPNGQQVVVTSTDQVEFNLQIDVFSSASEAKNFSAKQVAHRIRSWMNLCGFQQETMSSGLTMVECGAVEALPTVLESKYESRARLNVRFRLVDGTSLKTTWIETVTAPEGTIT